MWRFGICQWSKFRCLWLCIWVRKMLEKGWSRGKKTVFFSVSKLNFIFSIISGIFLFFSIITFYRTKIFTGFSTKKENEWFQIVTFKLYVFRFVLTKLIIYVKIKIILAVKVRKDVYSIKMSKFFKCQEEIVWHFSAHIWWQYWWRCCATNHLDSECGIGGSSFIFEHWSKHSFINP